MIKVGIHTLSKTGYTALSVDSQFAPPPFKQFLQTMRKSLMHITAVVNHLLWSINYGFNNGFFILSRDNMLIKLNNLLSHVIIIRFVLKRNYIFE